MQELRKHLHSVKLTTWACDDIRPGEPQYLSICAAMCRSRRCLLLVTQSYIDDDLFHFALNDALGRQCRLGLVFCLPVYHQLDLSSRPYQLGDMPAFDYSSSDFWQKLECAIKSEDFLL